MITVGDFLAKLIVKGGGSPADDKFKIFFGNAELVKAEVPDDVVTAIDNGLISLKDAKNNHPDIKNHYYTQALNGVDDKLKSLLEEYEVGEDVKNAVLAERNTYNRVPLMIKKMQELEQKKATANKPDLAAINKEKEELNRQIIIEKNKAEAAQKDYEGRVKQMKIEQKQRGLYTGLKTIYDTLDEDTKDVALNALFQKELQDNNAELTLDGNGNIVLLKKDGTNFYGDNNQQVNPKQFVEQTLSRKKILVTNQPAVPPANGGVNNNNPGQPAPAPNGGTANGNTKNGSDLLKSLLGDSMKDLNNTQAIPIMGNGVPN